jgi:O-antigen/teichoic acid export membrane protein
VVAQAIALMGLVAALRFCEGAYRGAMFGLQKQVRYNAANAVLVTLRFAGVIAVLKWVSPTIGAFFLWQGLVSVLSVAVFAVSVHRALPRAPRRPSFSREAVAGVWKFASGMMAITLLALLLTQVDKLLLSRLLPLESFGYYSLAGTVAGVLYFAAAPITQALSPRLVELHTQGSEAELASAYHQGAQLVTVLAGPAGLLLGFFANGVIYMWSGDAELARNTSAVLSVLAVGTFLNTLIYMPYQLQLAHGWTGLAVRGNAVAVAVLIPALFWAVPRYGALGAAWIWLILNAGYVAISMQLMHRRLLPAEKRRWYVEDVFLPVSGALAVMLLASLVQPAGYGNRAHWLLFLLASGGAATAACALLAGRVRRRLPGVWLLLNRGGQPKS